MLHTRDHLSPVGATSSEAKETANVPSPGMTVRNLLRPAVQSAVMLNACGDLSPRTPDSSSVHCTQAQWKMPFLPSFVPPATPGMRMPDVLPMPAMELDAAETEGLGAMTRRMQLEWLGNATMAALASPEPPLRSDPGPDEEANVAAGTEGLGGEHDFVHARVLRARADKQWNEPHAVSPTLSLTPSPLLRPAAVARGTPPSSPEGIRRRRPSWELTI